MSLIFQSIPEAAQETKPLIGQAFGVFGECFITYIDELGYVEYQHQEQAQAAMKALSNQMTNGVLLRIRWNNKESQHVPEHVSTPSNIKQRNEGVEFQGEGENIRMNIEEETKGENEMKSPISIRERVHYAVQNGLEGDKGPKDIHFSLLYFNTQSDAIINKGVLEYCKTRLPQVLLAKKEDQDVLAQVLKELHQDIDQLQPLEQLLSTVIDHFQGSLDEKKTLRYAAIKDVETILKNGYGPFLQKKILSYSV